MFVLLSVGSIPTRGQSGILQDLLNVAYKGKTLLLRNFYSGSHLKYDQNGILVSGGIPGSWTLAYMEIKVVTVSTQGVEVLGNWVGAVFQNDSKRPIVIGRLKIDIARPASMDTEAAVLPTVSKIFIDPEEDLRPMLPDYWRYYLTGSNYQTRLAAWEATLDKFGVMPQKTGIAAPGAASSPQAVYTQPPEYTKEAMSQETKGRTLLEVVVDATGSVRNIGIMEPLGLGLDEQAVATVERWKFQPSKLNGRPVSAPLNLEINFRCCH